MSKRHYRWVIAGILLCITLFTLFWWNERRKVSPVPDHRPYSIEAVFKSYSHPPTFWTLVGDGLLAAEREFDVTCNITAPDLESDIDGQIGLVRAAIGRHPDAIVLAAADYELLAPVCQEAVDAGIVLITLDSDVNCAGRAAFIGTDNVEVGRKLGRLMAEQIGDEAKFGVISHVEGTATATDRLSGLMEATPDAEERMAGFAYCEGSEELAQERAEAILRADPDIACIVGLNESSALGVANALTELGLADKVKLVVCDSSEKQVQFLENGTIQACVVQNPFSMGYQSVVNAISLLNKKPVEARTYTASEIVRRQDLKKANFQQLIIPLS